MHLARAEASPLAHCPLHQTWLHPYDLRVPGQFGRLRRIRALRRSLQSGAAVSLENRARHRESVGHDDYALERIPPESQYPWWPMAIQRFGQLSALFQFFIGATLGLGMSFRNAFLALTFGALVLEVVAVFTGIIGQREGLSTSVLARWTGFGQGGSALIGLAIAISLVGWFGVQSAIAARGLVDLIGVLPEWAWSLAFGLAVTAIVVHGFRWMAWTACIAAPAMLALAGWSIITELSRYSLEDLVTSAPTGPSISLAEGTVLVAGGFIIGSIVAPDMTRFNRSTSDIVKQTVVGIALGEYVIGLIGVLLAHALRTTDVAANVTTTSGAIGPLVILAATVKINDWNLYSASLGVVNFAHTVLGRRIDRALTTIGLGVLGSVLAAVGVLDRFTDFLALLGVAFPPVAGIMIAEYFVVRAFAGELAVGVEAGREARDLPESSPRWVPATLLVWLVAALVGKYVVWGLGSLNALVVAFILYAALGKLGLVRSVGRSRREEGLVPAPAASH
ncbi:cytosine permease [Streptomyces sp. NPDC048506]|uniref:purine-cytosine permease family protein n=1 Tax=Streptomyces sp. NPDC048506 TaxID=3155028 RepID=UPI003432BCEB